MVSRFFSGGESLKPVKLYLDLLSQPCRALDMFVKINKIPNEVIPINLGKMEHLSEEYEALNPFRKVPVLDDNGFILTESVAIFRHFCRNYKVDDKWYPKDPVRRARVDEYLSWQHTALRAPCALYTWAVFFTPEITGEAANPRQAESRKKSMIKACDDFNDVWLKDKSFVTGKDITFADILAACELQQLLVTDYDPQIGRPQLRSWLQRVRKATNPYFDKAHARLVEVSQTGQFISKL